ncbi:MAG: SDR family NAD(P)-dependent oxidoreductase [Luteolibacter sp.]
MCDFTGQTIVITGAGSGVGKAIAIAMAENGASVALVGRHLEALEIVANMVPGKMKCYVADLVRDEDISKLHRLVIEDCGGIDLLIHCAGVFAMSPFRSAALEDFDRQYRCNVRAPFALTQIFLPSLLARQGQVVFINSTAGLNAGAGVSQYAATKHALKAVADSLRQEVNGDGMRVLSVFLGRTATPMLEAICKAEGSIFDPSQYIQPHDVAQTLLHALSLPRTAEIVDLTMRPMKKPLLA